MLSSDVREILATTEAVIVDEIHAVAQTKRGAHLALTLERLDDLVQAHSGEAAGEDSAERRAGGVWGGPCRATAGRLVRALPRPLVTRSCRDPADRALGHAAAAGADRSVPRRAEAGVQRSSTRGGRRSWTWRSSCQWRTWRTRELPPTPPRTASPPPKSSPAPTSARSGPRSTPSCWSWSRTTPPRSSSSTTAALPSVSPRG